MPVIRFEAVVLRCDSWFFGRMVLAALWVLYICLVFVLSFLFWFDRFSLFLYSSLSQGYGGYLLHCITPFLCTFPSLYFD